MDKNTHLKWQEWFGIVHSEIEDLLYNHYLHNELQNIINRNSDIANTQSNMWRYFFITHVTYVAMGIRRQIKDNNDSVSLIRLLREMSENIQFLNNFEHLKSGDLLGKDEIRNDMNEVFGVSKKIETLADRIIAHRDRRSTAQNDLPNRSDLNNSVDKLKDLLSKYHPILTNAFLPNPMPIDQDDPFVIFDKPWRRTINLNE